MTPLTPSSLPLKAALPDAPTLVVPGAQDISPAQRSKAEQAAIKFEGMFINLMLKQMRSSAHEIAGDDGLFQHKNNNSLLDLTDTMLADTMAGQRAFGIADAILQQLLPGVPAADTPLKFLPLSVAWTQRSPKTT